MDVPVDKEVETTPPVSTVRLAHGFFSSGATLRLSRISFLHVHITCLHHLRDASETLP